MAFGVFGQNTFETHYSKSNRISKMVDGIKDLIALADSTEFKHDEEASFAMYLLHFASIRER